MVRNILVVLLVVFASMHITHGWKCYICENCESVDGQASKDCSIAPATPSSTPPSSSTPSSTPASSSTPSSTPASSSTPSSTPASPPTPSSTPAASSTPSSTPASSTAPPSTPASSSTASSTPASSTTPSSTPDSSPTPTSTPASSSTPAATSTTVSSTTTSSTTLSPDSNSVSPRDGLPSVQLYSRFKRDSMAVLYTTSPEDIYAGCATYKTTKGSINRQCVLETDLANFCTVDAKSDCEVCREESCNASATVLASAVLGFVALAVLRLLH